MHSPKRPASAPVLRVADIPSGARRTVAIVGLAGFIFLLVPRLTGWVGDYVHKEDGTIFLTDWLDAGLGSILDIYSGYLHVFPRLVAGACAQLPAEAFPACVLVATSGVRVWYFVLAAAVFIGWMPKQWKWAVVAAAVFLFFGPGQQEVWGNLTNLRWFGVAITGIALAASFRNGGWAISAGITACLAALTDPIAIGFVPVALWGIWRGRGWARVAPALYLVGALVQLAVIRPSDRGEATASMLDDLPGAAVQGIVRGITASQFGILGTSVLMLAGGVVLAVLAAAVPIAVWLAAQRVRSKGESPAALVVYLFISGVATLGATFFFALLEALPLDHWWAPQDAARYSALAALFFIPALVVSASMLWSHGRRWSRAMGAATLALLALGAIGDFRGDPWNTRGPSWVATVHDARERCIAPDEIVTVPITPQGVPLMWDAKLPCDWLLRG